MKQKKSQVIIFISIFLLLFLLAATAGYIINNMGLGRADSMTVQVEDISSKITSGSGEEQHVVDAEITLELRGRDNGKIDRNRVQSLVRGIMMSIDYDKGSGVDGMEYIKSEIQNSLQSILPEETDIEIFITTLLFDDPYSTGTGHKADEPKDNSEILKGIFQNIEN